MSWPEAFTTVTVGAMLVLTGCGVQATKSSDHPDPCALLSKTQITALTGGPTRSAMPTGTGDGCNYAAGKGATVSLLITIQTAQTAATFSDQRALASKAGADVVDLHGAGDQAFAYSAQNNAVQSAQALTRSLGISVLLTGDGSTPANARQGLQEALATAGPN